MKSILRLRAIARARKTTTPRICANTNGQAFRETSTSSRSTSSRHEGALPERSPAGAAIALLAAMGIALYAGMRVERLISKHESNKAPIYASNHEMHTALDEIEGELRQAREQSHRNFGESLTSNNDNAGTRSDQGPLTLELEDLISTDDTDIQNHAFSEWSTSNSTNKPFAIIYPETTEDVSTIARICTKHRVPMVPYGAGSSVEGSFSAPHSGFTVDFSRMDKILSIHPDDMDCVVQPGVNWVTLNKTLADAGAGLFVPMDPSPTALVGADGTVLKTRRRPRKSSAGYDLTRLFVGAEGTLGFVTEATLKLAVVPRETGIATCSFPDVKSASAAAVRMMREGMTGLAALEIMDEMQMKVINRGGGTLKSDGKSRRLWREEATLFFKFSGADRQSVDADVRRVEQIAKQFGGTKLESASNEKEKDAIWAARKEALWAMLAQREEGTEIWSTDVAVPLSRLSEIIDVSKKESSELGLFNSVLGHVGDGNFHQSVMYHPSDKDETAKVAKCVQTMMDRALEMEGTVSGEHAIGLGKMKSLHKEVGEETINMMRRLKLAVDPFWLLNPGKVFEHKAEGRK
ncbi:hypothetical protein LTR70_006371 [Exophiala xenobiotica]|nr:hypothetical protein LTR70_006371 [Exophiala xenobiotica]